MYFQLKKLICSPKQSTIFLIECGPLTKSANPFWLISTDYVREIAKVVHRGRNIQARCLKKVAVVMKFP